jgi:hypothetical protein
MKGNSYHAPEKRKLVVDIILLRADKNLYLYIAFPENVLHSIFILT